METEIVEQGARLRCYVCGLPHVAYICHHCGRPVCSQHGPARPLLRGLTENREFGGLTLNVWPFGRGEPVHCAACLHVGPNYRRLMIAPGIAAVLLGMCLLLAMLVSLGTCLARRPPPPPEQGAATAGLAEALRDPQVYEGLPAGYCYPFAWPGYAWRMLRVALIMALGALTAGLGLYLNRQRAAADSVGRAGGPSAPGVIISGERISADAAGERLPVPLAPASDRIEARETIQAEFFLDSEGRSTVYVQKPLRGEIRPGLYFTAMDQQRVREYRARFDLGEQAFIAFRAGYLALEGRPWLHFAMRPSRRALFWLSGQVGEYPYLAGGNVDPTLPLTWDYVLPEQDDEWGSLPVRLLPLSAGLNDVHRLTLQVQFNPSGFPCLKPGQEIILEEMRVLVDRGHLGYPHTAALMAQDGDAFRVEWRNLRFAAGTGLTYFHLPEIRFERPIQPGSRLAGQLRLCVPALRSGLSGVRYFSALGHPVDVPFHGETRIQVEFELALAPTPQVELVTRAWSAEFGGAPEPERVRRLVDRLNVDAACGQPAQRACVHWLDQAAPDGQGGGWRWNISGRRYHQALPVDFHLAVYTWAGQSRVEAAVQGQVFDLNSWKALEDSVAEIQAVLSQTALD